ncbi:MAG: HAD family hydrolase [Desulfobulbus sp.]|jgi:putative hydrolase of the HAD superfamily|uniref:HAD family hydrolase n=1 Tax=Desulfobulbus sp. TaxID=895 RepID=UPI0028481BFF|nr:HAD family hydrolase [Desulfobulbus sp.]MDR2548598.1 HAD family hydrolase [Desulfobulbus sp.]
MRDMPRQLMLPRAVIFDLDNTLYPYPPSHDAGMNAVAEKLLRDYGITPAIFLECFSRARNEIKSRLGSTASSHSRLLYFMRTLELLGFKSQPLLALDLEQSYWRNFLKAAELFPGVIPLFEFLKTSGISIAIVTDLTAQIQLRKLVYFNLDKFIDCIVTSEEAGTDKPGLVPFTLALEKLNLPASEIWAVGDDEKADMQPALHLSLFSVYKASDGTAAPSGVALQFRHFAELNSYLEKLKNHL